MSRNPAWNAYNEKGRQINDEYENTVKPLRIKLGKELEKLDKRIQPQIDALVSERTTLADELKAKYAADVKEANKKRTEEVKRAHDVLNAELEAARAEKVAA